jgi:oligo-1,6-glucosidase
VRGRRYVNAFALFADGPRVHEYLAEMTREVFGGREGQFLTVGEMPGVTPDQARLYTDQDRAEINMVFQFEHVQVGRNPLNKFDYTELDRVALKRSLHRWQAALADKGWNSLYWSNHDQPRVVSWFGDDDLQYWKASATALATVLHSMRGTPYIYQGEELGMTNYPFRSGADYHDLETVNYHASVLALGLDEGAALSGLAKISRDNARTPMQWNATPHAGFTSGVPWMPVNPNYTWINAESQVGDPHSVFAYYQTLVRLRHEMPIFVQGDFIPLMEDDAALWAYMRRTDEQRMLVLANCGREPRDVYLPGWERASLLLGNMAGVDASPGSDSVTLAGWEARIYIEDVGRL